MIFKHNFYVGLRDVNPQNELTNTGLLAALEEAACRHSESVGFGLSTVNETKKSWVLLSWKIKILRRPKYNESIVVNTWSRGMDKIYAYRDFKVYDSKNELVCIATSKWVFMDIENGKITKLTDDFAQVYEPENISVFEDESFSKLNEPKEGVINQIEYKITKNMIDINNHLNNIHYLDVAQEVLPNEINNCTELEVMYKKEVKLGSIVKTNHIFENDYNYVTIKSEDESVLHAIIKLK